MRSGGVSRGSTPNMNPFRYLARIRKEHKRKRDLKDACGLVPRVKKAVFSHHGEFCAMVVVGCFRDGPSGYGVAVVVPPDEIDEYQWMLDIYFFDERFPVRAITHESRVW